MAEQSFRSIQLPCLMSQLCNVHMYLANSEIPGQKTGLVIRTAWSGPAKTSSCLGLLLDNSSAIFVDVLFIDIKYNNYFTSTWSF